MKTIIQRDFESLIKFIKKYLIPIMKDIFFMIVYLLIFVAVPMIAYAILFSSEIIRYQLYQRFFRILYPKIFDLGYR